MKNIMLLIRSQSDKFLCDRWTPRILVKCTQCSDSKPDQQGLEESREKRNK